MSLEPRCRHGNIRSAEPCRDCDERDALRARVAELEAGISTAMQLIEGGFDSAAYEALEALNAHK